MLMHAQNLSILLCSTPTDMRKSINGLCLLVDGVLEQNPGCGTIYVFCNRVRNKIKLLYWDGNGFCLLYKRLEKGCFKIPRDGQALAISYDELRWLLQGINFQNLPKPSGFLVEKYA